MLYLSLWPSGAQVLYANFALKTSAVFGGELYRFFTYAFLHASWNHLLANMIGLLLFGPYIENRLGPWRYLGLYLLAGAAGGVAYLLTLPPAEAVMLGASGAVYALPAAALLLVPRQQVPLGFIQLPLWLLAFVWILAEIQSFEQHLLTIGESRTAYSAHFGGFVAGLALVWQRARQPKQPDS